MRTLFSRIIPVAVGLTLAFTSPVFADSNLSYEFTMKLSECSSSSEGDDIVYKNCMESVRKEQINEINTEIQNRYLAHLNSKIEQAEISFKFGNFSKASLKYRKTLELGKSVYGIDLSKKIKKSILNVAGISTENIMKYSLVSPDKEVTKKYQNFTLFMKSFDFSEGESLKIIKRATQNNLRERINYNCFKEESDVFSSMSDPAHCLNKIFENDDRS
jgi:hypothetical protein